jgi:hypothetical protein
MRVKISVLFCLCQPLHRHLSPAYPHKKGHLETPEEHAPAPNFQPLCSYCANLLTFTICECCHPWSPFLDAREAAVLRVDCDVAPFKEVHDKDESDLFSRLSVQRLCVPGKALEFYCIYFKIGACIFIGTKKIGFLSRQIMIY